MSNDGASDGSAHGRGSLGHQTWLAGLWLGLSSGVMLLLSRVRRGGSLTSSCGGAGGGRGARATGTRLLLAVILIPGGIGLTERGIVL